MVPTATLKARRTIFLIRMSLYYAIFSKKCSIVWETVNSTYMSRL